MTKNTDVSGCFDWSTGKALKRTDHVAEHKRQLRAIVGVTAPKPRRRRATKPFIRTRHYAPWHALTPCADNVICKAFVSKTPVGGRDGSTGFVAAVPNTAGFKGRPSFESPYTVLRVYGPMELSATRKTFDEQLEWLGVADVNWVE